MTLDDIDAPQFSICEFIKQHHEFVCRRATLTEASRRIVMCVNSTYARDGVVTRIIMLNGQNRIVFEWKYGAGVVFPPKLKGMCLDVPTSEPGPNEALEDQPSRDSGGDSGVLLVRSASR